MMKLIIVPSDEMVRIDGVDLRIWKGHDQSGTPVELAVKYVSPQTHDETRLASFEKRLKALPPLKERALIIDYCFVVD